MKTVAPKLHVSSSARARFARRLTGASLAFAATLGAVTSAEAAGLNNPTCTPSAARPYPVVVVHGQAGNFEGMSGVTNALVRAGYCVYARNYGYVPGGANGQDHLSTSADQISSFVNTVLAQTKATKVNVVGHSAGVGVLNNYIQKKGGAAKVHRAAMFGGLHHPYAHVGVPHLADATLYLPNMIAAARRVVPGIKTSQVVKVALDLYAAAGAPLGMVDPALRATMESNFTSDLFDPDYWQDLQGGQSEEPMTFITFGNSSRSKTTNDAAPNVCYTNIVAAADLLTGPAAGFQDEAPNVDNFLLVTSLTPNAHNDMLGDPIALGRMLSGFDAPCTPATGKKTLGPTAAGEGVGEVDDDTLEAFEDAVTDEYMGATGSRTSSSAAFGCSTTRAPSRASGLGGLLAAGMALLAAGRRRSSKAKPC